MKKGRKINIIIALIIIITAIIASFTLRNDISTKEICFESSKCLNVELAQTPQERTQGLMFRASLPSTDGMFFIFPNSDKHAFWMKNTLIPLDIIWLNSDLEIVHIEHAQPCYQDPCPSYIPPLPALYVLETNQGFTDKNNISIGDKLTNK